MRSESGVRTVVVVLTHLHQDLPIKGSTHRADDLHDLLLLHDIHLSGQIHS